MSPRVWLVIGALATTGAPGSAWARAAAAPRCDSAPELRGALKDLDFSEDLTLSAKERRARLRARLGALRARYPGDGDLARRMIEVERQEAKDPARVIERHRPRGARARDPRAHYLHARALMGRDTRAAIAALEKTLALAPGDPEALAALIEIYRSRGFTDRDRARKLVEDLTAACPGSARAARLGGNDRRKELAALLRAEVGAGVPPDPGALVALWDLEFKLRPPAEHAALRKEIAAATRRLRDQVDLASHPRYFAALTRGYRLTSDADGKAWVEAEIVRLHPRTREGMNLVTARWEKDHPRPGRQDGDDKRAAFDRDWLAATTAWVKRWPGDAWRWNSYLNALRSAKDPPRGAVAQAGRQALAAQARHELASTTVPLAVARLYLAHRVGLPEAVRLLERLPDEQRAWQERARSDLNAPPANGPPADGRRTRNLEREARWQVWPLLAELEAARKQPARAQAVLARMDADLAAAAAENKDKPPPELTGRTFTRHRTAGVVEEALGRKREAVLAYQKALATEWSNSLRDKARKLWGESGGTEEGWKALAIVEPAKTEKAPAERWEAASRALPRLELSDLSGRQWTSRDLVGKTLFVNMWATWCGPCKAELPQLKKLHERLAGRSDVLLLSLNVDDSVGDVEPFVREQEMAFPVLLANDYVVKMLSGFTIPRNWVVSPVGVVQRQQTGYDPAEADRWVDEALAQITTVAR